MSAGHDSSTVLVTGASGFLGAHCVAQLLAGGYRVRGTLRSLHFEPQLRAALAPFGGGDRLAFVRADLAHDEGWAEAVAGCDYVLHVAAPYPSVMPKEENDLIIPARDGTLRVLRAAVAAGVRRVVYTSSIVAIAYGHEDYTMTLDESVWTNLEGQINAYIKSKTLAERAAWELMGAPGRNSGTEMVVINPGFIFGPSLDGRSHSSSGTILQRMLKGEYPGCARLQFWCVDVRDVAAVHVAALTNDRAVGRRYLCLSEPLWMNEIAAVLDGHLQSQGQRRRVATRVLPDFAVRLAALVDGNLRTGVPELGRSYNYSTARIQADFDWQPRSAAETVTATADNLLALGAI